MYLWQAEANMILMIGGSTRRETSEIKERCTLKVPVVVTDNGYAIEALPVYVTDVRRDTDYNSQESVLGSEIDSEPLKSAVTNFLDAYYSQDQSMINYLLAAGVPIRINSLAYRSGIHSRN